MKSRALIQRNEDKLNAAVEKYCTAQHTMLGLSGPGVWELQVCVLERGDICTMEEVNQTIKEATKRARKALKGGKPAQGHQKTSWLWLSAEGTSKQGTAVGMNDGEC